MSKKVENLKNFTELYKKRYKNIELIQLDAKKNQVFI